MTIKKLTTNTFDYLSGMTPENTKVFFIDISDEFLVDESYAQQYRNENTFIGCKIGVFITKKDESKTYLRVMMFTVIDSPLILSSGIGICNTRAISDNIAECGKILDTNDEEYKKLQEYLKENKIDFLCNNKFDWKNAEGENVKSGTELNFIENIYFTGRYRVVNIDKFKFTEKFSRLGTSRVFYLEDLVKKFYVNFGISKVQNFVKILSNNSDIIAQHFYNLLNNPDMDDLKNDVEEALYGILSNKRKTNQKAYNIGNFRLNYGVKNIEILLDMGRYFKIPIVDAIELKRMIE